MIRKYAFLLLIFIPLNCCYGQLIVSDSANFDMKASIGGSLNDGNFQRLGITSNADIAFNTNEGKFGFVNHSQYNYTKTFGAVAENDVLTRTIFYTKFKKNWYALFVFWFETNKLRQLQPLLQIGPSLQYAWLSEKENSGAFSLGTTYEHKHYKSSIFNEPRYNHNKNINIARFFARLHGKNQIGISKIALTYDIYFMPSFEYYKNYRIHSEMTFEVPISKNFSLHAGMNYNYESIVISGVKPTDFFTEYGLSINF